MTPLTPFVDGLLAEKALRERFAWLIFDELSRVGGTSYFAREQLEKRPDLWSASLQAVILRLMNDIERGSKAGWYESYPIEELVPLTRLTDGYTEDSQVVWPIWRSAAERFLASANKRLLEVRVMAARSDPQFGPVVILLEKILKAVSK